MEISKDRAKSNQIVLQEGTSIGENVSLQFSETNIVNQPSVPEVLRTETSENRRLSSTKGTPYVLRTMMPITTPLTSRRDYTNSSHINPPANNELHEKVMEHLQLCKLSESAAWREAKKKTLNQASGITYRPKVTFSHAKM